MLQGCGTTQVRQEGWVHVDAAVEGAAEEPARDEEPEGHGDDEVDGFAARLGGLPTREGVAVVDGEV